MPTYMHEQPKNDACCRKRYLGFNHDGELVFFILFLSVNGSVYGNSRGQSKHRLDQIEWNIKEDLERALGEVG